MKILVFVLCLLAFDGRAARADEMVSPPAEMSLSAERVWVSGLSYEGIAELRYSGTVRRLMRFRASLVSADEVRLSIGVRAVRARKAEASGQVVMYAERLSGKLLGLLPLTFSTALPPPLVPPVLSFTDVTAEGVVVDAEHVTAEGLAETA